jgi:cyclohexa-1,5-dienecarbonyl-CoA hydratase
MDAAPAPPAAEPAGPRVLLRGSVAHLVLDRPPLNILDLALLDALDRALAVLSDERSLKCLVVRGAGRAFCAGVDVADHTDERVGPMLRRFHAVVGRLLEFPVPVIAAVHGAALGGGAELMLAADVVLARDDVRIGFPEIRLGAFPPVAAALLPAEVGRQRALDLVLSGRIVEAAEARDLGLVATILPRESFEAEVDAYAARLAGASGAVLRLARRAVREASALPPREGIAAAEALYLGELMALEDAREGVRAFMEKREPAWTEG